MFRLSSCAVPQESSVLEELTFLALWNISQLYVLVRIFVRGRAVTAVHVAADVRKSKILPDNSEKPHGQKKRQFAGTAVNAVTLLRLGQNK